MLLTTINLPKSSTFLSNFCKGVKMYHFPSEVIFGQLLQTFGDFFLVTLLAVQVVCYQIIEILSKRKFVITVVEAEYFNAEIDRSFNCATKTALKVHSNQLQILQLTAVPRPVCCSTYGYFYLCRNSVAHSQRSQYTHRESMIKKSLDKLNTLG